MKLLNCHIDNFGGLSDCSFSFEDGLTVIKEDNGFGKTTLAEFIRAMFYGMPRSSSDLDKNRRKKYEPWQGGSYGGYLEFEYEGRSWRIVRSFGTAPRFDRFALYDENQRESSRFGENIGEELFKLDSDSFERSTYMPQIQGFSNLSTASIQAKLGNLVEDTNDINNYDKAIAALKKKRSSYETYKGRSGSIADTQDRISILQTEADADAACPEALTEALNEKGRLQQEIRLSQQKLEKIRQDITAASESQSALTLQEQYRQMGEKLRTAEAGLKELDSSLPEQLPTEEEIDRQGSVLDNLNALSSAGSTGSAEAEAGKIANELKDCFASGIPSEAEIQNFDEKYRESISLSSAAESSRLTDAEEQRFQELSGFFSAAVPTVNDAEQAGKVSQRLKETESREAAAALPQSTEEKLKNLKTYFAMSVPSREAVDEKRREAAKINELHQENLRISAAKSPAAAPEKAGRSPALPLLIIGLISVAAGIALLIMKYTVPGAVLTALGAVLLVLALYLNLKHMIKSSSGAGSALSDYETDIILKNNREIQKYTEELESFCAVYDRSGRPVFDKLTDISAKLDIYLSLSAGAESRMAELDALENEAQKLRLELKNILSPYFTDLNDITACAETFCNSFREYSSLNARRAELQAKQAELRKNAAALRKEIGEFIHRYYPGVPDEDCGNCLVKLRKDSSDYSRALQIIKSAERSRHDIEEKRQSCLKSLEDFGSRYGVELDAENGRRQLQLLRDRLRQRENLFSSAEAARKELAGFAKQHEKELSISLDEIPDIENLKEAERKNHSETELLKSQLQELCDRANELQERSDALPGKLDELQELKESIKAQKENCSLIDRTIEFLSEAKEALNNRYLGPIKESFARYMALLHGEEKDNLVLSPELDVSLQRSGEPKELKYFSAGQADCVMLCMRLALVDALFKDTEPFIILDDPFVNLDDRNTAEALSLLKKLSEKRQIIYLVCNSSRV